MLKFLKPISNPGELLAVKEAAAIAKASVPTVRRWIRLGKLKSYGCKGRPRIDREDLIKFLCNRDQF